MSEPREHEVHWGDHNDYACELSGPHCWACNEPWPCRASRGRAVQDDGLDVAGLDLRCEFYVGPDHKPAFDRCAANGRPRGGKYTVDQWCLPCEVRARLRAAPPLHDPTNDG